MKHLSSFVIHPYLPIFIGALLGAALGYFGHCTSGTCPLTSTWWRGALYGGTIGLLFVLSSTSKRPSQPPDGGASETGAVHPKVSPTDSSDSRS